MFVLRWCVGHYAQKDATCVCTGVDPAIRFQFSTQQHFESFSETVKVRRLRALPRSLCDAAHLWCMCVCQDVVELRRLSLLKARLATRLLTSRKPPALYALVCAATPPPVA